MEAVQSSYELTRRTTEAGRTSELDLRTAESQLETARAQVALAQHQRAQAENALVLLVGGPLPATLPPLPPLDARTVVAELAPGVPSEVLLRRPDVLAAEHALLSANADIGAARAAFFPSISLTATAGTASSELSGLFGSGSFVWTFAPRINLPIFTAGRLRASLDVAEVRKDVQVARYEGAIQAAFRDVADALVSKGSFDDQIRAQEARVKSEQRRYHLSELRYRGGVDSYLNVLTAQRDLYASQVILIDTRRARLVNLVQLYKALGGGWLERRPAVARTDG
jgi:multidrug efflux system outer membrane protein